MLRSILIFVLGLLIIMRLNSVWHTIIKGGLKFVRINSTIKWIYYFCALYLFYTISYVIISDIPITSYYDPNYDININEIDYTYVKEIDVGDHKYTIVETKEETFSKLKRSDSTEIYSKLFDKVWMKK